VVFFDTELCEMARVGAYVPLDTADAVERTAAVLDVFDEAGLPVIRVGLCASDNLSDASKVYGGASDAAIGEMAMSELYFSRICRKIDGEFSGGTKGKELTVYVKKGNVSKAVGQKKTSLYTAPLSNLTEVIPYKKMRAVEKEYGKIGKKMSFCPDMFPKESILLVFEDGDELTILRLQCGSDFMSALKERKGI
jgi:histone acetyltransferase (RNA polymerase elongator complex component)